MNTLMQCSQQWSSRPDDERFTSLSDLHAHTLSVQRNSRAKQMHTRALQVQPVADDPEHRSLQVIGANGTPAVMTHWAFNQLCQRADAPAGYLRSLPAEMTADCINYGLHHRREVEDIGILVHRKENSPLTLRAATGPAYGRIWNSTITGALVQRFGDGLTGDFRIPGEFGQAVPITKSNTTLYASDRDMFVFLADEQRRITLPNRRNGQSGSLARGFFVYNSEVGSKTFGIALFLFDYVCKNRIVWGVEEFKEIKVRHTRAAPMRWLEEIAPTIERYSQASSTPILAAIEGARAKKVDDVDTFLARRFSRNVVGPMKAAFFADEQRPIETLWDVTTAATAYARDLPHQDARVDIEREAGKLLHI